MKYSSIVDGWYRFRCPDCGEPLRFSCHVSLKGAKTGDTCSNCDSRVVIIAGQEPYLKREGSPDSPRKKTFRHKKDSLASEPTIKDEQYFVSILKLQSPYTIQQVRQAYKEQMKQYHPDQVDHLGQELKDLANLKSKGINEAFEYFSKKLAS